MEVNTAKTKISVIGRNTNKEPFWWKRTTIERVEAYKYLGVWTTTDGSYGRVKQHLANQGKQSIYMYSLKTTIRKLIYPPVLMTLKLFETMVLPILSYESEIWGFMEDISLEAVELHYLKYILHVPLTETNIAVRGELGQLPIQLIWKERILRYWDRLCSNDIPMLLKKQWP